MTGIPHIDVAPFLTGDGAARREVAAAVDAACREIGFFTISGHGVEQAMTDATYAMANAFFRLPLAEKLAIRQPAPEISRGYTPLGGESLSYGLGDAAPPDLKEMIDIGPVDPPPPSVLAHPDVGHHFHANLWPVAPVGFEAQMTAYYRRLNKLADTLMQVFAVALDLPADHFAPQLDHSMSALRLLCYPEQDEPPVPGQLRGGAHTDYGTLTILTADAAAGGLQARARDGTWVDVKPARGQFVVNIGDVMPIVTNDRWVSTLHRVVNPPAAEAFTARRHSIVFFHQPNFDAVIETLPGLRSDGGYPAVTYAQHWTAKWMATKT